MSSYRIKEMEDLKSLEEKLIKLAFILSAVIIAVSLYFKRYEFAAGLIIGTFVSVVNFKLLAREVVKKAQNTRRLFLIYPGYILRYGLMAAALIISAKKGIYYFSGVALGLFAIRMAIFTDTFFFSKWKSEKSLQKP